MFCDPSQLCGSDIWQNSITISASTKVGTRDSSTELLKQDKTKTKMSLPIKPCHNH